ncbi:Trm112 family protein [Aquipuribacter sp. MA13-6]|uniref:Trm112 family protein n=1 Tax=unclassified Aquipuribacter TaxID=2635084 RepID=UPI003EED3AED
MSSTVDPWLREILRCPACRSTLLDVTDAGGAAALRCAADAPEGCGRTYRYDRGVPVLLVDEGELPGPPEAGPGTGDDPE